MLIAKIYRKLFVKKSKGNNNERTTVGDPQSLSLLLYFFQLLPLKEEIFRRDPTCQACSSCAAEFFLVTSRMDSFSKSKALLALMTVKRRCERISNTMDQYANYLSNASHQWRMATKTAGNCLQHHFQSCFCVMLDCWAISAGGGGMMTRGGSSILYQF